MKKIVFTGLFLLSGITIVSAQVKLSFNPEKGKKYEYQTELIQLSKNTAMGQEMASEMEMSMKYLMEIAEKTPQETKAQFTYQDISYIITSPMMKMGYDSKNPIENPSDMDKMLGKMFGTLIGKPFTLTITPDGSVKSVTGMDAIAENMTQSVAANGQMAAQMSGAIKQQFGENAIKGSFEQSLKIYPANAVKAGDSWVVENTLDISNMNTKTKTKYTLKGIKNNMADIVVESTLEMKPGAGMEGSLTGTQTGTMQVDVKTGMPVSSDMSQSIKGTLKTQGIDILTDMTNKVKLSTKEVK